MVSESVIGSRGFGIGDVALPNTAISVAYLTCFKKANFSRLLTESIEIVCAGRLGI